MIRTLVSLTIVLFLLTGCVLLRPIEDIPPKPGADIPEAEEENTARAPDDTPQENAISDHYRTILDQTLAALLGEDEHHIFGVQEAVRDLPSSEATGQIGYKICDLSGDGVPELVIGSVFPNDPGGTVIYELFTEAEGEAKSVFGGWARNKYLPRSDGTFFNRGSGGSMYSLFGIYALSEDGTALTCQDFYYSWHKDEARTDVVYYRNTTGEQDPATSELLNITRDDFWAKEEEWAADIVTWDITPFSEYAAASLEIPANS